MEFFATEEGYVKNTVSAGVNNYTYAYNYKDQVGNIRLSYAVDPSDNVLKILEENHYYPFGLKHTGYSSDQLIITKNPAIVIVPVVNQTDITYRYKYNGKELQDEWGLNTYDYGWRSYMPDIGRWTQVDPLINDLKFTFDESKVDKEDEDEVFEALTTKLETGDGIYNMNNLNPYGYGYNNPVSFEDPDGRCPVCVYVVAALLYSEFANAPTGNKQKDARDYNAAKGNRTVMTKAVLGGAGVGTVFKVLRNSSKSKAIDKASKTEKKVPNPNGKTGGPAHQKTVDKAEAKLKEDGFTETKREVKVDTPNGSETKRYVDVQGKNPKTGEVKQIQVGKQNKNLTPVARERRAMDDIEQATGKRPEFHPYN